MPERAEAASLSQFCWLTVMYAGHESYSTPVYIHSKQTLYSASERNNV